MVTFTKANLKDLSTLSKCFRRSLIDSSEEARLSSWENQLPSLIEEGDIFMAKEGGRILSVGKMSHSVNAFLGENAYRGEAEDLLESLGYRGEMISIIDFLLVDPSFQRKGIGTSFLTYWQSIHPKSLWLCQCDQTNGEAIAFFKKNGFIQIKEKGSLVLLGKPYRPTGICREAWW